MKLHKTRCISTSIIRQRITPYASSPISRSRRFRPLIWQQTSRAQLNNSTAARWQPQNNPIAIAGVGSFGYSLLIRLAQIGFPLVGLKRDADIVAEMNRTGSNPDCFSNIQLFSPNRGKVHIDGKAPFNCASSVLFATDYSKALRDQKIIILACTSGAAETVIQKIKSANISEDTIIISIIKGFIKDPETENPIFITTRLRQVFPNNPIVHLGGPSFALGLYAGEDTGLVAVSDHLLHAVRVSRLLNHRDLGFIVNVNNDPIGVQFGHIMKNIIAIGTGACQGIGWEVRNAMAQILGLGRHEMRAMALQAGGTMGGLLDIAVEEDITMTSLSETSRNMRLGILFAKTWETEHRPPTPQEIEIHLNKEIAEGYQTAKDFLPYILEQLKPLEFPLYQGVYDMLFNESTPHDLTKVLRSADLRKLPLEGVLPPFPLKF